MGAAAFPLPDFVVEPDVQFFHYGEDQQAAEHDAGGVSAQFPQVPQGEVTGARGEPGPELADGDEGDAGEDADVYSQFGIFFAVVFAEDVRGQEGGGKEDVAQGLVESEGVYLGLHFNVGRHGGQDYPGRHSGSAEEFVADQYQRVYDY